MSEATPPALNAAAPAASPVRAAIARAAQATGMDFDYLLAQAKLESALDPAARARTSSAAGLYQFTRGTWLETLDRHGAAHGLGWAGAAISGGRITDPGAAGPIMALRFDPDASALMAAELARDNRTGLAGVLGREPDAAELYLGHFLGLGGASRFLAALARDPEQSAAALLPKAAAANRPIFYDKTGSARSVGQMMDLMRRKVENAMEGAGLPFDAPWAGTNAPSAHPQTAGNATWAMVPAATPRAARASPPQRTSMAETLRSAFAVGTPETATQPPAFVREAYAKLARLGL